MNRLFSVLAFACLLIAGSPAWAQNLRIESGFDVFQTLEELNTEQSFADCPVPGFSFEDASQPLLTGCTAFMGTVRLKGEPLEEFRGVTVGAIDTIVERTSTLDFGEPEDDATLSVDVQLLALNLVSVAPVQILCDQGLTHWSVKVQVDDLTGPSSGEMQVTLEAPQFKGGTVASELNVCPRVTFTRVDPGATGAFEIYPCDLQCGPDLLGDTTWAFDLNNPDSVLKIDDFTTANFYFTERLPQGQRVLAARANGDCEPPSPDVCPRIYPHQEATAAHLGCIPNPCAQDTHPPQLIVPAATTCECAGRGGSPINDACIAGWIGSVSCLDALSSSTCAAENPPSFFPAACAKDGGHPTTVTFTAEDECCNATSDTAVMTVEDSLGPVVTSGDDDLYCLAPPNHAYSCFAKADFDPDINDVCGTVDDWIFTGCASDQPDDGDGDGNTVDDCHVCQGPSDTVGTCANYPAGYAFCVRAEHSNSDLVDPDKLGRRYSVEIQATDGCMNLGDPAIIGHIHVPRGHQDGCISPPILTPACSADPTTGEVPLAVSFSDQSTATGTTIASWQWDFDGDGVIDSSEQNPTFTYSGTGTYRPTLTISDGDLSATATCPRINVTTAPGCALDLRAAGHNRLQPIDIAAELGLNGDVKILSIWQDEPLTGCGAGNKTPDGEIRASTPSIAWVRPERCSQQSYKDGRVYHIELSVEGADPPPCGGEVTVCVPHGGPQDDCVDGGRLYDSTVP